MSPDKADLARFLIDLGSARVRLETVPGDSARIRHQPAKLPEDIAVRLIVFRPHLHVLLRLGYGPTDRRAVDAFSARLSVARSGGQPVDPGSPAWWIAIGESMLAQIGGGK